MRVISDLSTAFLAYDRLNKLGFHTDVTVLQSNIFDT